MNATWMTLVKLVAFLPVGSSIVLAKPFGFVMPWWFAIFWVLGGEVSLVLGHLAINGWPIPFFPAIHGNQANLPFQPVIFSVKQTEMPTMPTSGAEPSYHIKIGRPACLITMSANIFLPTQQGHCPNVSPTNISWSWRRNSQETHPSPTALELFTFSSWWFQPI